MPAHPKTSDSKILKAVRRLLERYGPGGFSTNDVADAVGVRAPSLYGRFRDRAALLNAVELTISMKDFGLCVAALAVCLALPLQATARTNSERHIDDLTSLNCPIPGVSGTGTFNGFLAQSDSMKVSSTVLIEQQGQLRLPVSCQNASVSAIMRIGPAALPALLRHLDDKRPTKLVVGRDVSKMPLGGQFFADEYDARRETWPLIRCSLDIYCGKTRSFDKPYTVKVGDVCFVLIGQIVNRLLNAVRYQPTAIVFVNSPIESPELAKRVRADWTGTDDEGVKSSLLSDLHTTQLEGASDTEKVSGALEHIHSGALLRLRFYFPNTYASLTGADLEMRKAFERAEREQGQK